jgi:hypothetical protein
MEVYVILSCHKTMKTVLKHLLQAITIACSRLVNAIFYNLNEQSSG